MQQDIRYALRSLGRSPGYTLIAVTVLALGIGATSAIFSFVDGVLLRPLPYANPDRIVMVWERPPAGLRNAISTMNFLDWDQQAGDVLESLTGMAIRSVMMAGPTEPVRVHGQRVSTGYFEVFAVAPALGRTFQADDGRPGSERVAVISHRLWRLADQYFSGIDPIGQTISVERIIPGQPQLGPPVAWRIVGIVANDRTWTPEAPDSAGMYATLDQSPQFLVQLIARTTGDATQIARGVKAAIREVDASQTVSELRTLQDIKDETTAPNRLQAGLLGVFSGLSLILAAVGIYGVMSYSVAQRTREIGLRAALGATRASLVNMVLRRAMVLTALGLALGMAGALAAGRFVASLLFGVTPRDGISMAVAGITLGAAALMASWVPARRAAAVNPIKALRVE